MELDFDKEKRPLTTEVVATLEGVEFKPLICGLCLIEIGVFRAPPWSTNYRLIRTR